ncbi:MAG: PAS domain-containing protein [Hymenobacter sp.]
MFELANPLTGQLLGRPVEELLGQGLFEAVPETAGLGFEQLLGEVRQTGVPYVAYESPSQIRRDGRLEVMYWNFVYQPLRDLDGWITGIITVATDATAQVLARQRTAALQAELLALCEQQLREREALYQVFEQAPAVIAVLREPQHRIEFCNSAFQRLFSGRELRGRPMGEVEPETASQGFVALLDGVYRTGETHFGTEVPLLLEQPDGQPPKTHYFNFTYQRFEESGQPAGVSVFAYDVAEQVLARREREAQRVRQRELFEQVPVALGVFTGPDYVVEVCNPKLEAIWGRTAAEVLGRPLFEALPEVRDQGFRELLDGVRATGTPHVAHEMPGRLLHRGELTTVYLNFVYHPLRDAQGNITAVAAVANDVSEQVAARRHLAEANADLTAANAQLVRTNVDLDTFIYTASHDLKQPYRQHRRLAEYVARRAARPGHRPGRRPGARCARPDAAGRGAFPAHYPSAHGRVAAPAGPAR